MSPPSSGAGAAVGSLRMAIIGDVHAYSLTIWPWELLGKTLAGQMNLWLNRRKTFLPSLIEPTVSRACACGPHLTLFSGDLTTTSRATEFRRAAEAIRPLTKSCSSVIVAGNHDRYTFSALRSKRLECAFGDCVPPVLPHVRPLVGGWKLIAVDSATPRPFDSRGRIGARQLQEVRSLMQSVDETEGVIVLCHYPFGKPPQLPPMKSGHRLLDEGEWRQTIAECRGRVIVVHGHVHCPWLWRPRLEPASPSQPVPRVLDVNAGSPTMVSGGWPRGQGFWTLDLHPDPSQPIALAHHVMGAGDPPVGADEHSATQVDVPADPDWTVRAFAISI